MQSHSCACAAATALRSAALPGAAMRAPPAPLRLAVCLLCFPQLADGFGSLQYLRSAGPTLRASSDASMVGSSSGNFIGIHPLPGNTGPSNADQANYQTLTNTPLTGNDQPHDAYNMNDYVADLGIMLSGQGTRNPLASPSPPPPSPRPPAAPKSECSFDVRAHHSRCPAHPPPPPPRHDISAQSAHIVHT